MEQTPVFNYPKKLAPNEEIQIGEIYSSYYVNGTVKVNKVDDEYVHFYFSCSRMCGNRSKKSSLQKAGYYKLTIQEFYKCFGKEKDTVLGFSRLFTRDDN